MANEKTQTEKTEEKKETKGEAFERIAKRRVSNVLNDIKLLEGLAATTNYEYTEKHWEQIFGAIEHRVSELKKVVQAGGKQAVAGGFSFGQ